MATLAVVDGNRLPFSLGVALEDQRASLVLARLDHLERIVTDTRRQIDLLRKDNHRLLQALIPTPDVPRSARVSNVAPAADYRAIRVQVLGSLRIDGGGASIDHWSSRKSHLLLAYLASEPRRVVTKDALTDLFWPDCASARASNNLSIAIHQIRSWLRPLIPFPPNGIRVQQGLYSLDPAVTWLVDLGEMRSQLTKARAAARAGEKDKAREHNLSAVQMYSGEFLASDPYEEWTIEPRRAAEQELCAALRWLADDAASLGDWTSAVQRASQCIQHDPCDEQAYRALMTGYWKQGNRALALQNYRSLERALRRDLSITPSDETIALARAIGA